MPCQKALLGTCGHVTPHASGGWRMRSCRPTVMSKRPGSPSDTQIYIPHVPRRAFWQGIYILYILYIYIRLVRGHADERASVQIQQNAVVLLDA